MSHRVYIETCTSHYLTSPPEPLALRLSSNLMMGVARVYSHQTNFFYGDVNSVIIKLKRTLSPLQTTDIDLANPEVRLEHITLENDIDDTLLLFEQTVKMKDGKIVFTKTPTTVLGSSKRCSEKVFDSFSRLGLEESDTPLTKMYNKHMIYSNDIPGSIATSPLTNRHLSRIKSNAYSSLSSHQSRSILLSNDPLQDFLDSGDAIDVMDPLMKDFGGMQQDDFDIFTDYPVQTSDLRNHDQQLSFGHQDSHDFVKRMAPNRANEHTWLEIPITTITPSSDIAEVAQVPILTKRIKLAAGKRNLFDEAISLPDEPHSTKTNTFIAKISNMETAKFTKKQNQVYLQNLMHQPDLSRNLNMFWHETVVSHFDDVVSGRKRPRFGPSSFTANKQIAQEFDKIAYQPNRNNQIGNEGNFDNYNFDEPNLSAEIGRALESGDIPLETHVSPKVMPWHVPSATNSSVSELRSRSKFTHDTLSSLSDGIGIGRKISGIRNSDKHVFDGDLGLHGVLPVSESDKNIGFEFDTSDVFAHQHRSPDKESTAFYEYIRSIMVEASTSSVHLFDLLEHVNSRTVASQAFFNVLNLATKNRVRIYQFQPYGDIELELCE
ncbi:hypothetical protein BDV3_001514 [Batrachochytrium dendrobatidis]|nr:R8 protein [Batrachochytrium dendrobatidis]